MCVCSKSWPEITFWNTDIETETWFMSSLISVFSMLVFDHRAIVLIQPWWLSVAHFSSVSLRTGNICLLRIRKSAACGRVFPGVHRAGIKFPSQYWAHELDSSNNLLKEDMFQAFIGSGRTDTRDKLETLESAMLKKEIPAMKWRMQAVMVLV